MATATIHDGHIVRVSAPMPKNRAVSFKAMLEGDDRKLAVGVTVINHRNHSVVEWRPTSEPVKQRCLTELQESRRAKIDEVKRYGWKRAEAGAKYIIWHCRKPDGTIYVVRLSKTPHCTCHDFDRVSEFGIRCKHILCALEAEKVYRRRLQEAKEASCTEATSRAA